MANQKYFTLEEVTRIFGISRYTVCRIEAEGFIRARKAREGAKTFSREDVERIRLIIALSRDLGVNWAGVEVILHMRERMLDMQRQVEEIFDQLQQQMEEQRLEYQRAARSKPPRKMSIIEVLDEGE